MAFLFVEKSLTENSTLTVARISHNLMSYPLTDITNKPKSTHLILVNFLNGLIVILKYLKDY